jgi:polysaccharide export outer membrane protein
MATNPARAVFPITVFALSIWGQAQNQPAPAQVSKPDAGAPATTGAAVDPKSYHIGPEDILIIQVWREPDFSRQVGVRPDGKITMPLIGELQAGGLTPVELGAELAKSLNKYINTPDVSVSVAQVNSKKYYINGEVMRTGAFALAVPTTVMEALSQAGGFKEFANKKKIKILRGGKPLYFNYNEVVKGKHLEQNILLEPGDFVIVQ